MSQKNIKPEIIATVGRRKRAVARVRIKPGSGQLMINNQEVTNINPVIKEVLELTGLATKVDIWVKVYGGGTSGQTGAIRHGIARALVKFDPDTKTTIKKAGFLTRDPREKERKKFGLKRARRAPQWAKR